MSLPAQRTPSTPAMMYRAIVGIGMLCALVIVGVYAATASRIAENEARALRDAVSAVLPAAAVVRSIAIRADGEIADEPADTQELPAFVGYDASGQPVGVAITAAGMGYQDTIRVIYAYSYDESAIVGLRVLQSLETPGLGDKIETDADFVANFERLDVSLSSRRHRAGQRGRDGAAWQQGTSLADRRDYRCDSVVQGHWQFTE